MTEPSASCVELSILAMQTEGTQINKDRSQLTNWLDGTFASEPG